MSGSPSIDEMVQLMAAAEGLGDAIPDGAEPPQYVPPFAAGGQMDFYRSKARFCLAYGERFSGKTWVGGHKIVDHCWSQWNALAIVVVSVRRQATAGGIWYKLINEILPEWKINQPGFESTDQKMDPATKDLYIWVRNRYGGWSQIQLISIPFGGNMAERVRGIEPSMIYVDELTTVDGPDFFDVLIQQLGRRKHIASDAQQYVATTNPDGPSHWVYQRFFVTPLQPDGSWDMRYFKRHIPISENPSPSAQQYFQNVLEGTRNDPIEYARLIKGEWVDRPSGDAIFLRSFVPEIHVRGDRRTNEFLRPVAGLPLTLGFDLGDANHSISFLQERPTKDKTVTIVFDELVITDEDTSFEDLVPELMDHMNYWGKVADYKFSFESISDRSAFDRFRAASGSYDHRQVEMLSRQELEKRKSRYPFLTRPIKLIECPKPPGSVAARIKVVHHLLQTEELFISALCERHIDALKYLESEKDEPYSPKRSKHLHVFDSLSYPLYYRALGGAVVAPPEHTMTPQVYQMRA